MISKLRPWLLSIIILASLLGSTTPVLASVEETGVTGTPQLAATVIGSNEFPVGQSATLQIMLLNKGTFTGEVKSPADKAMARGYTNTIGAIVVPPCTTAVAVTATLKSATDSFQIASGPASIGTLATGASIPQPLSFPIRVAENAQPGAYQLTLELAYQYLQDVTWLNSPQQNTPYYDPEFEFSWGQKTDTEDVSIKVVGTDFSVTDINTESIRVGATGIITAMIQNSGVGKATEVTAEIAAGDNFVPLDKGVFLGDLNGGESKPATFKVNVSPDAIAKESPLNIMVKYKDETNVARQSTISVGVPVGAVQKDFTVTKVDTQEIRAGVTGIVTLTLKNDAAGDTHEVTAEVVPGQYFVPVDVKSFLGEPGQRFIRFIKLPRFRD